MKLEELVSEYYPSTEKVLKAMKGRTLISVSQIGDEEIVFDFGLIQAVMYHEQSCCESVWIEDVCGDLTDLVGVPILHIEERTDEGDTDWGTFTHTFYTIRTIKGTVDIRWNGESNGYYSEAVDMKVEETTND